MSAPGDHEIETLLTRFIKSLRFDQPPEVSLPADAAQYVDGLHGDVDVVARPRRDIVRVDSGGVLLFTGRPGSGKSTELMRLRRDLLLQGCKAARLQGCKAAGSFTATSKTGSTSMRRSRCPTVWWRCCPSGRTRPGCRTVACRRWGASSSSSPRHG